MARTKAEERTKSQKERKQRNGGRAGVSNRCEGEGEKERGRREEKDPLYTRSGENYWFPWQNHPLLWFP